MAKECEICGKGQTTGNSISRSRSKSKRTFKPNIQKIRVLVDGKPQRMNVCTTCIKSGRVVKAP